MPREPKTDDDLFIPDEFDVRHGAEIAHPDIRKATWLMLLGWTEEAEKVNVYVADPSPKERAELDRLRAVWRDQILFAIAAHPHPMENAMPTIAQSPHAKIAERFARDVAAGKIEADAKLLEIANLHLTVARAGRTGYHYDAAEAAHECQRFEHLFGRELSPRECFAICVRFGWRDRFGRPSSAVMRGEIAVV